MTDSSQTRLAYVPEVTYGTTPATPAFKNFRTTSIPSLSPQIQYLISDEIRPDRNIPSAVAGAVQAAFDVPIELSYGSFDDMLSGLLNAAWATNVLKNGVTQKSFTFENTFVTAAGNRYQRIPGAVVNTMTLNVQANGKAEGSFGIMGQQALSSSTAITGATYAAAPTTDFYKATDSLAVSIDAGAITAAIMSLSLNVTNNDRQRPVIGSQFTAGIGAGRFEVTGTLNAYFNDSTLYDKFLSDVYTSLKLTFTDASAGAGNIEIFLPKIKLTGGKVNAGANNTDVMAEIQFTAVYDSTEACAMKITRTPTP